MCANDNSYQYYIYAGLSALVLLSEALGLTKNIPPNSILQAAAFICQNIADKYKTPSNDNDKTDPLPV